MAKMVNIPAGAEDTAPPTLEELQANLDTAQEAVDALRAERAEKRNTLPLKEFKKYNEETAQHQLDTYEALYDAQRKLASATRREAKHVAVGTAKETSKAGKGGK